MYLHDNDTTPYQDIILNACLHNTTYDPQVEGYKTMYLLDIIDLTHNPTFYVERILQATHEINETTQSRDADQLAELTYRLAQRGDSVARQVLYDTFLRNLKDEDSPCTAEIVMLDGAAGFAFVLEHLAPIKRHDADAWFGGFLYFVLEETIGEAEARQSLDQLRTTNDDVAYCIDLIERSRVRSHQGESQQLRTKSTQEYMTYDAVKQLIESGRPMNFERWGRLADKKSLLAAANDLLQQEDVNRIRKYLMIFRSRPFPLDPSQLFRFVGLPDYYDRVSKITLGVLQEIQHPAVRQFAHSLIEEGRFVGEAAGLFTSNFALGDWSLLQSLTTRKLDDTDMHSLGMSIQDIFDQNPSPDAAQTLLNFYENGPCSFCREGILLQLNSIDALPDFVREECKFDANEDIRVLAQNNFELLESES